MPAVTVSQLPDRSWMSESFAPTVSEPRPPYLHSHFSSATALGPLSPISCLLSTVSAAHWLFLAALELQLPSCCHHHRHLSAAVEVTRVPCPLSSDMPAMAHSCATQQKKLEAQRYRVAQDQAGKLPNEAEKLLKVKNVTKHIYLKTMTRPAPPRAGKTATMLHPGL